MKSPLAKYLESTLKLRLGEKKPLIQVILGPRQIGKTTFIEEFIKSNSKRYHYVSADGVQDAYWISEEWQKASSRNQVLIIDEIQKVPNWSEIVKKNWDGDKRGSEKTRCILLGSSSLNLSHGLSESMTGRFELLHAYHWNYYETKTITDFDFTKYLLYGGYPGSYSLVKDSKRWQGYLRSSIIETVITRDILIDAKIKSPALFRQCFYVLANYPSQVLSYNKILGQLQDKGNVDLVKSYIRLFEAAFLFKSIHKYSRNELRKNLSSPKIIGFAPALYTFHKLDNISDDYIGKVFESAVGACLARSEFNVFYWAEGDHEIDFVVELGKETIGIEVKSGSERITRSIPKFLEKYPKAKIVFVTFDNYPDFEKDPKKFLERYAK